MCCSSRPGVQMRIFIEERRSCSLFRSFPPMINPAEKECFAPAFLNTSKICTAWITQYHTRFTLGKNKSTERKPATDQFTSRRNHQSSKSVLVCPLRPEQLLQHLQRQQGSHNDKQNQYEVNRNRNEARAHRNHIGQCLARASLCRPQYISACQCGTQPSPLNFSGHNPIRICQAYEHVQPPKHAKQPVPQQGFQV